MDSRFWSPRVAHLVPYTPGEQPKDRTFVKLNTNENPYGPSPAALAAIRAATGDALRLYPDPTAAALRAAIAASHGLTPDHVFVGNGSDEVLGHAFNAFFGAGGPVVFADITYSFYPVWCDLYGLPARRVALDADFRLDPAALAGPATDGATGIVIANPNAPTGIAMDLGQIEQILTANPDTLVLVDEAYVDFGAASAAALIPGHDNLLVVHTFSKSRSLAGLRVGFALGQPPLIEALTRIKDSFNSYPLGRLALDGALAAWQDRAWFDDTRARVMAERTRLTRGLGQLGFRVLPSAANFLFAEHTRLPAEEILAGLRARGVLVRHFRQQRIRNWLRITVGTPADGDALLDALRDIVAPA